MCVPMLGAVVGAVGSIFSGMTQAAGYEAQAEAKKIESLNHSNQGAFDSRIQDDRNKRLTGQQVTAVASSGVDLWGTPVDVIAASRAEGEMDKMAIRFGAQGRSQSAAYEGQIAKMNASSARIGGFIGAIAPMVNGVSGLQTSFA
jgi:hypothetical protein